MKAETRSNRSVDSVVSERANVFTRDQEISCLCALLKKRGLSVATKRFMDLIDEGDIFEIYDDEGKQIYRSWSFFRHCRYSAGDLTVYDWNELFVRPKWIENYLRGILPFFFRPRAGLLKYDLPEHMVYERHGSPKRLSLIKMKYASAVLDSQTSLPKAFITTGSIRRLHGELPAEHLVGVLPII